MWDLFPARNPKLSLFGLGLAFALAPTPALSTTQNSAFQTTDVQNRAASDDSMQVSTTYAMTALMDLGNLNVPGAVKNGMTAYGKYRNSETLDKLGDMNYANAQGLSSIGGSSAPATRKTDTTFRRLDPSFLRKGEAGKVAEEFEKKSGMSRDAFLAQMSDISEKKIKRSDPQLIEKVLGRFEGFLSHIPNQDFKGNLQKAVGMVPESVRNSVITNAVSKYANMSAALPNAPAAADTKLAEANPATPAPAVEAQPEAPAPTPAAQTVASRAPASDDDTPESERDKSMRNLVLGAIDTQGQDETIFQQVSRKYRVLTGQLVPPTQK